VQCTAVQCMRPGSCGSWAAECQLNLHRHNRVSKSLQLCIFNLLAELCELPMQPNDRDCNAFHEGLLC
jgi:hypothetical protein